MGIAELLNETKKMLNELARKKKFEKANQVRAEKTQMTMDIAKCAGNLNVCKVAFRNAIKEQYRNIAVGRANGYDTLPQEQIMWDAAVGYLLVEDAAYALTSLGSYDSMTRAYELLDAANDQITNKKRLFKNFRMDKKERGAFGQVGSEALKRQKEEIVDSFFEELKQTGDIEKCVEKYKNPRTVEAERRLAYTADPQVLMEAPAATGANSDSLDDLLNQLPDSVEDIDFSGLENDLLNIKPPKA